VKILSDEDQQKLWDDFKKESNRDLKDFAFRDFVLEAQARLTWDEAYIKGKADKHQEDVEWMESHNQHILPGLGLSISANNWQAFREGKP